MRHGPNIVSDARRTAARKHATRSKTCLCGRECRGNGGWSAHIRACPVWGKARDLPLTEDQLYVLGMVNPEWPSKTPDAKALRILRWLDVRGLTYENFGRWYINDAGCAKLAVAQSPPLSRANMADLNRRYGGMQS